MGTTVSPAQAKQWLTATRGTLVALQKIYPLPYSASELPMGVLTKSTRNRVLGRLVSKGYIKRIGKPPGSKYIACPDAIGPALQDDALISAVLWPSSQNLPLFNEEMPPPPPPPALVAETPEPAPPVTELAPPPPIDNMRRPPPGASLEVILEWIFTMLHAQTENLIYIREQVDSLLNEWRR